MKSKVFILILLGSFWISGKNADLFADISPEESSPISADSEIFHSSAFSEIKYSDQYFLSATRSIQKIGRVTDNITVITREELDRWPVSDLDEALGYINGIVVQDDGLIGQVATAQIYGSKPREVRVMIDGITMNPTTSGGIADLSQIPLDIVEKIEIVKGASSSVWGSAMGGVINIITRPTGKQFIPKGRASFAFGEFGVERERGEINGALGPLHYFSSGSLVESRGFRPHSDELEKRGFIKSDLHLTDELALIGSFGYSGSKISEFQVGGGELDRKVYTQYGSGGFVYSPQETVSLEGLYKISARDFRRDTYLYPSGAFFSRVRARSLIHELSFNTVFNITDNQTVVLGSDIGVDVYRDAVFRTNAPANVNKQGIRHAYYANYQLTWKDFDITLGSRLDATNNYGVHLSPSAGLNYHLPFWDTLVRANVSRAFNAPSLPDRYLSAGTTVANPDLQAEYGIAYNLGLETSPCDYVHVKSVFFQTHLHDSIQTVLRDDGLRQPVNIDSERRTGVENEIKLGPWHGFSPSYGTTYVKPVNPGKGPVQARPHWTQDIKLNWMVELWGMQLNSHLAGRYMDIVFTGPTAPIDQVFIFDGKIVISLPKILYGNARFFVEGENLFNQDFAFDGGNDPFPQRNFEGGVEYLF